MTDPAYARAAPIRMRMKLTTPSFTCEVYLNQSRLCGKDLLEYTNYAHGPQPRPRLLGWTPEELRRQG